MKQARASVSFSAELISWPLSVHMALFFLDRNPRKKRESYDHRRAQRLSRADHPTDGGYATDNRATFGQSEGWFTFSPVYLGGENKIRPFVMAAQALADYEASFKFGRFGGNEHQSVNRPDGQVFSQERGCILHWRLCWWVCSQTEWGGEGAALLGQLSLACHPSVSSALLDIYLPCRAAGPVTCHSLPHWSPALLEPLTSYIPTMTFHTLKYSENSKMCLFIHHLNEPSINTYTYTLSFILSWCLCLRVVMFVYWQSKNRSWGQSY